MQAKSSVPDAVVIGKDDGHPVHVQPAVHSGRRHLDIRPWRRSNTGFAPTGNGMTLDGAELDALEQGIRELLEASAGGRQVARVVFDDEQGRRLRAEVEPFGTRYVAKLGFWQRARNSWKQVDDGLMLSADGIHQLGQVIQTFRQWIQDPDLQAALAETIAAERELLRRWPLPGADWLTQNADRIAFHPRGVRITCVLSEEDGRHLAVLQQWRRDESLWLPEPATVCLDAADLDALLRLLARLTDTYMPDQIAPSEPLLCSDGVALRIYISGGEAPMLHIEEQASHGGFERRLIVPQAYLPRFGRALAQTWSLLAASLPEEERTDLERLDDIAQDVEEYPEEDEAQAEAETALEHEEEEPSSVPVAVGAAEEEKQAAEEGRTEEMPALTPTIVAEWTRAQEVIEPEEVEPDEAEPPGFVQPEPPLYVLLRSTSLGRYQVAFSLQGSHNQSDLVLTWEDSALHVPLECLDDLLPAVRALYYEALLGRRGRVIEAGDRAAVRVAIDNHGFGLFCQIRQEQEEDRRIALVFPASEVPAFLDAAETALALR